MPRTPDGAVNDKPVRERSVVVAAVRIDRENLGTFADQQNLPVSDMADQLAILENAGIDTLRQVRSTRRSLLLSHLFDPPSFRRPSDALAQADRRNPGRTVSHQRVNGKFTPGVRVNGKKKVPYGRGIALRVREGPPNPDAAVPT
jgi:hypothetical protein